MTTSFGTRLRALRDERGLSRDDLVRQLHVSSGAVRSWENDGVVPGGENLRALALLLGTSADYLLGITNDPTAAERSAADEIRQAGLDAQEQVEADGQQESQRGTG